ncbi:MAG: hypothetical protein IJ335_01235 [Lachnospiraceae bacterium]|nr:hypothetical protein [Lachnospiraceae bacterium]
MITYPEAYFNFIDVTALEDSKVASTTAKDFSNISLFREDTWQAAYGTMELNQFVLDGSMEMFPEESPEDVAFWSDELSGDNCLYVKNPTLEISFAQAHTSSGLTLYFAGDAPAEILVTWYTLFGSKLVSKTFYPDAQEYFCKEHVQNYGKITIEFVRSAYPYQYVKLDHVEYGQKWRLGRENIKSANVAEEIDPTSATLPINTVQMEILDAAGQFEMTNEAGLWKAFQKEQEIAIRESVNGSWIECGTYYLDNWSSQSNVVKFSFIDVLGLMDKTMFYGGAVYVGVVAGHIIDAIMVSCGISNYIVDEDVYNTELNGWLGILSHREALQQVVFACGAVADRSRAGKLHIHKASRQISGSIGIERKFTGTKLTMDEYVSSVTVQYQEYHLAAENRQICKGTYPAGSTMIEFSAPYQPESVTATVGVLLEVTANYAVLSMDEAGESILSGLEYEAVENAYTASVAVMEAGEVKKNKKYSGCTLVDSTKAAELAKSLLDYYQLRQLVEIRYINMGEAAGDWCEVALLGGGYAVTGITNQTIDLTGGNIATSQSRGYSRKVTGNYYAGAEIYTGEDGII